MQVSLKQKEQNQCLFCDFLIITNFVAKSFFSFKFIVKFSFSVKCKKCTYLCVCFSTLSG